MPEPDAEHDSCDSDGGEPHTFTLAPDAKCGGAFHDRGAVPKPSNVGYNKTYPVPFSSTPNDGDPKTTVITCKTLDMLNSRKPE